MSKSFDEVDLITRDGGEVIFARFKSRVMDPGEFDRRVLDTLARIDPTCPRWDVISLFGYDGGHTCAAARFDDAALLERHERGLAEIRAGRSVSLEELMGAMLSPAFDTRAP